MIKTASVISLFLSVFILVMTGEQSASFHDIGSTDKIKTLESISVFHTQIKKSKTIKLVLLSSDSIVDLHSPQVNDEKIISTNFGHHSSFSISKFIRGPPLRS